MNTREINGALQPENLTLIIKKQAEENKEAPKTPTATQTTNSIPNNTSDLGTTIKQALSTSTLKNIIEEQAKEGEFKIPEPTMIQRRKNG